MSIRTDLPGNKSDPDRIDFLSPEVQEMHQDWALVTALRGTRSMRAGGEVWLPREDGESPEQYQARLRRTYLFPAFCDQIKRLIAKPFSRPVTLLGAEPPEALALLEDNTDGAGRALTATLADFATDAVAYGLSHLLVDFPSDAGADALPTWRHIRAIQVLGWRSVREGGREILDEIRFRDDREEPAGKYGSCVVPYIVHMTREFVQRWQWDETKKGWVALEARPYSFNLGDDAEPDRRIPIVTAYTNQTGFMTATPPLMGLADLNLAHWQSTADQRNVIHYVRVPLLVITGLDDPKDQKKPIVVSSAKALKFTGKDVKVIYAEHQGRGADAGQKDLETLEDQMEVLGLQPNVRKTVAATATSQRVKEGRTTTQMQEWLRRMEAAGEQAYRFSARWMGEELPEDFEVDIFSDFAIDPGAAADLEVLLKARIEGEITRTLFLEELKRRATLAESVDPAEVDRELKREHEQAMKELPRLGAPDDRFGDDPADKKAPVAGAV